jgi:Transposase DDE domain.
MWNSVLAGIVFQHDNIEKLRRELARNGQLREMCGFWGEVPPAWVYTRFLKKLLKHMIEVDEIFEKLVEQLRKLLPDFGKHLAVDSKAIPSFARHKSQNQTPDGRRDTDADYGRKEYRGQNKDGSLWEKIVKWFGYKLHLVVEATYELPVAYKVTKASASDAKEGHALLEQMEKRQPEILRTAETLAADKGYDDTKLIKKCWDQYQIKPVIDIRNMWKDGEETRLLNGRTNVTYNHKGNVYCYCPKTNTKREMPNGGFEKDRNTLKKLCPAKQYGIICQGQEVCPVAQGLRIPLPEDRRIFTPIDRASYKWEKEYDKRTSVERVNSRLDVSFGFELHTIRGMAKMKLRCGLALCVMLAMAVGRIKQKQGEKMRSLVAAA